MGRGKRQSVRDQGASTRWHELLEQWRLSGQSQAAFCRERGLSATHFNGWKRRLERGGRGEHLRSSGRGSRQGAEVRKRTRSRDARPAHFAEVKVAAPSRMAAPILPAVIDHAAAPDSGPVGGWAFELDCGDGLRLRWREGVTPSYVGLVLAQLSGRGRC